MGGTTKNAVVSHRNNCFCYYRAGLLTSVGFRRGAFPFRVAFSVSPYSSGGCAGLSPVFPILDLRRTRLHNHITPYLF